MCSPITEQKLHHNNVILFYLKVRSRLRDRYNYNLPLWDDLPHAAKLAYQTVVDLNDEAREIERLEWQHRLTVDGLCGII